MRVDDYDRLARMFPPDPENLSPSDLMTKIAMVYFDLGNILYRFDRDRSNRQIADCLGIAASLVEQIVVTEGLGEAHERGELDDDQFVDWMCRNAGVAKPNDQEKLLDAASDMFTLIDGMPEIIERVASNVRTGLLSNTCDAHFRWIKGLGDPMMRSFDPVILSFEAGAMKPSQQIYVAAENAVSISPSHLLFVDDKPENVAAAKRRGWNAELCQGAGQVDAVMKRYGL